MIPKIGEGRDRVDGRAKVTGSARFAAENNMPGLVHGVVVMSTIPAGRIRSIDATAAMKLPGVLAVLSHLNAPKLNRPPAQGGGQQENQSASGGTSSQSAGGQGQGGQGGQGQGGQGPRGGPSGNFAEPRLIPFSDDRVQYLGQQIAVVVATTLEQATHGASLVKVAYEPAPSKTDMAALRSEAKDKPAGPDAKPFVKGDPMAAFAAAPVKIDQTYRTPYEHHNPMEAHSVVAVWDGDNLTLHDSSQNIFASRQTLARAFSIPVQNIRVLSPFVGGAFGSKGGMWPHVLVATMAARVVRRPVKLWMTRRQLFFTNGHRPETEQRVAIGAGQDGRIVSLIHEGISQSNEFCDYNERFSRPARVIYASPNISASNQVVELNVSSPTYMRAPGESPGMFAIESAMDELAERLSIDPIQLRILNHADVSPDEGKPWSSKSLKECYRRAADRFGWSRRTPQPRSMRDGNLLIGFGMASATYPAHRSPASAKASIKADGSLVILCGSHEMGMGTATVMAQLAAETMGIPPERVRFEYGDTTLPQAPISAGSMTVASVGSAVYGVTSKLLEHLINIAVDDPASPLHGADPGDVTPVDGRLVLRADRSKGESMASLVSRQYRNSVDASFDAKPDEEESKYAAHAFGAHFAEVSVDPDLMLVRVRRIVSAFAAGRVLNAKTARSQYIGGITWGIGMALLEQTHFDRRLGSYTSVNLGEYLLPVNADVPSIEVLFVEEDDPHVNPIGAKGIGEIGIVGVAPAIANAVHHATGKRVRDLPITVDKLL